MALSLADFMQGHVVRTTDENGAIIDDPNAPSDPIDFRNPSVNIPEDEHTLFSAVRFNDLEMVDRLLRQGADINMTHEDSVCMVRSSKMSRSIRLQKYAPLHVACLHSSLQTVEHLLDKAADVDILDNSQRTPLHCATAAKRHDIVKLLINRGADLNIQTASGKTPLMEAVLVGHPAIVQSLVDANADFELQDIKGSSALYLATSSVGNIDGSPGFEILKKLIKGGANVNVQNHLQATPLMLAAGFNSRNAVKYLLQSGADINHEDHKNMNAFHICCQSPKNMDLAWILARQGADVNSRDKNGKTPLDKSLDVVTLPVIMNLLQMDCIRDNSMLDRADIQKMCNVVPFFDKFLKNEFTQPWSLMRLCRYMIRSNLSGNQLKNISDLSLPRYLADYLMLR